MEHSTVISHKNAWGFSNSIFERIQVDINVNFLMALNAAVSV